MSTGELAVKLGLPTFTHAPIPKLGLYKDPVLNPLSPNWVIAFYSASFHKVSRIVTHDKYGVQAWLLVACSILQPIYNCVPQDVHRSQGQVNNTSTR